MNISSMRHMGHRRLVHGSGKDDSRNFFASYFLRKEENPLPCRRSSKYDDGQESWTGTPESSGVSSVEVLNIHAREHRTGMVRDRRRSILQCRLPPDPK